MVTHPPFAELLPKELPLISKNYCVEGASHLQVTFIDATPLLGTGVVPVNTF